MRISQLFFSNQVIGKADHDRLLGGADQDRGWFYQYLFHNNTEMISETAAVQYTACLTL